MNRRVIVNVAVFGVAFVAMLGWLANRVVSFDRIERPYKLSAEFANAFGVLPNAEVTYLGVTYGRVSKVERVDGGVHVEMQIRRGKNIPVNSTASIFRKSAIGEQYVDFTPPEGAGEGGPYYRAGARIPRERTTIPLEFSELLRSASALISAIPPESLATVLHETSVGLQGRTDSLRDLGEAGDKLAATLAARTSALDRLATNNTKLTKVLADHRSSLGQSLTNLSQLADSLNRAKGDVSVLLDSGSQLVSLTADVVARHKGDLDCSIKVLELLIDETSTPERLAGLRALLRFGPAAFGGVWDARDVETIGPFPGVWIRVGFVAQPVLNRPAEFVPAKELPPVVTPTACASPLKPSGLDYRLASTTRSATGQVGGASAALVLVLAAAAAALVLRQARPTATP